MAYPPPHRAAPPPQGVTPISGTATAAFWLAMIGPATFGIGSGVAIILAFIAWPQTRVGDKGGHFLTVTALLFGIAGLIAWVGVVFLAGGVLHTLMTPPSFH